MTEPPPPDPESSTFAVTARSMGGRTVTEVIVPSAAGSLTSYRPGTSPQTQSIPAPGGTIRRVTVSPQTGSAGKAFPGPTICMIGGENGPSYLISLRRDEEGLWSEAVLPRQATVFLSDQLLGRAVATGFVPLWGGKGQMFYASFSHIAPHVWGIVFAGDDVALLLPDQSVGVDFLAAPAPAGELALGRLAGRELAFLPATPPKLNRREQTLHARFREDDRSLSFRLPVDPEQSSAGGIVPITDVFGFCHGAFVRTRGGELYVCAFETRDRPRTTGRVTVREGASGPRQAREVRASFDGGGGLHIFVSDAWSRIWYTNWPASGRANAGHDLNLSWDDTRHSGTGLAAPQLIDGRPYVFIQGTSTPVARLSQVSMREWKRVDDAMPPG
jgi:hypothetical protein